MATTQSPNTSPFLNISIFSHIVAYTSSLEDLYRLRRVNQTTHETIHSYSNKTWRKLLDNNHPMITRSLEKGDHNMIMMAMRTLLLIDYRNALHTAITHNNKRAIEEVVKNGVVNAIDDYGSALCQVSAKGDMTLIQYFLGLDAKVNYVFSCAMTSLTAAVSGGHIEVVKLLLSKRASVNLNDGEGNWPLLVAITKKHYDIAELLLESGADACKCSSKKSSLKSACVNGNIKMINRLVKAGVDVNQAVGSKYYLEGAVIAQLVPVVAELLHLGADHTKHRKSTTLLEHACMLGNAEIVEMLLKAGADPNEDTPRPTLLELACWGESPMIIDLLFEHKIDVKKRKGGETYIEIAYRKNRPWLIKKLIDAGVSPNEVVDRPSPLQLAVINGETEVVRLLLACGANPNINHGSKTLIGLSSGDIRMMLMDAGAIPVAEDVHAACLAGDMELLQRFYELVDFKQMFGLTDILREVADKPFVLAFLFACGLDYTTADLVNAVKANDKAAVKELLDGMERKELPGICREAFNALLRCRESSHDEMLELILSYRTIRMISMSVVVDSHARRLRVFDRLGIIFGIKKCNQATFKAITKCNEAATEQKLSWDYQTMARKSRLISAEMPLEIAAAAAADNA